VVQTEPADSVSQASYQPSFRSKSQASNIQIDVEARLRAANQGKVVGMTSAEWNHTVQNDYQEWRREEAQKQQRLQQ
jgi:hypothetical protein